MAIKLYRQESITDAPAPPSSIEYGEMAVANDGTLYIGNKSGEPVSKVKSADSATNATGVTGNIRGYGISDATSDHYAWWLSYTGAGSYGGAKKYFACVHADQADSARASNIAMSYNGNLWISYS